MDVASLDISVKATGLRPAVASLTALGKAAATYKNDIAKLEKNLQQLAEAKLPTLGKGITQFKSIASAVDGMKGSTTSFTKLALAAEKLVSSSQGLKAVARSLESIKDSAAGLSGVRLSGITSGASTSGTQRAHVDQAAKQQQTLMRQIQREGLMAASGYDKSVYLEQRAAMLGVSEAAKPYIAQMRSVNKTAVAGEISQKQYNAALRMVPAQFTDIATQLAGGQNPFLIMLQQGGQLRDMFGSVSLTLRAVGAELVKLLMNPIVLVASAVVALGYAFIQASNANTAYVTSAVKLSGSVEGNIFSMKTAAASAAAMGASVSDASTVVQDFASRSVVSQTSLAELTATAVKFSNVVGVDLKVAMSDYIGLSESASQKALDLDKKYHFLTTSIYAKIVALENEGKQTQAVALANDELKAAQEKMTTSTLQNVGWIEQGYLKIKGVIKGVIADIMSIGAPTDEAREYTEKLAKIKGLEASIAALRSQGKEDSYSTIRSNQTLINELKAQLAPLETKKKLADEALKKTQEEEYLKQQQMSTQKSLESGLFSEQKLREFNLKVARATEEHWKNFPKTQANILAWEQRIQEERNKEFPSLAKAEKAAAKRLKSDESAAKKAQTLYESRQKELNAVIATAETQRSQIAQLDNYDSKATEVSKNVTNMLKWQYAATIQGIDAKEKAHALEMANAYAEAEAYRKINVEMTANTKAAQEYAAFHAQAKTTLDALNSGYAQEVAYLTMTNKERTNAKSLYDNEIERKTKILELEQKAKELKDDPSGYQAGLIQQQIADTNALYLAKANNITATSELANQELSLYDNIRVALGNYKDDLGSVNSIIQSGFTSTLTSVESAVESFVSGTSSSFKDLAVSVLKSISVMLAKLAILRVATMAMGLFSAGSSASADVSSAAYQQSAGIEITPLANATGNAFTSSGISKFAKGSAFTNSVVNSPTPFKFASGGSFSNGLMGEAGPEAVMPLTRMANGSLGVESTGGSGGNTTQNNVSVNVTVNRDGTSETTTTSDSSNAKAFGELMKKVAVDTIAQQMRPGGLLATR